MNCGVEPSDNGKQPHVDHIFPRSKFHTMELQLSNLQILCEDCNCSLKGTNVVDYRTPEQITLIDRHEGGKHKLTEHQRTALYNNLDAMNKKKTGTDKDFECRRVLHSIASIPSGKRRLKRLKHAVVMFGEKRVRIQSEYIK